MITAIVLISVDSNRIPEVAQEVADIKEISEVYSVTGDIDLVAMVRVKEHEELASIVSDQLSKVEGVRSTTSYIAFQAFSRHDLEQAFHIGLD